MDELTIIPTGTALGAEVVGLDLRRPLDTSIQEQLRAAFTAHSVLLWRDQRLSQADQLCISRCFGDPIPHPTNTRDRDPEYPAITILSNIKENGRPVGALGNDEVHWHIDLVFLHMPGSVSLLYCLETPDRAGDTWWTSGYAAYEALDKPTQQKLDRVSALYPPPPRIQSARTGYSSVGVRASVSSRKTLYLSPGVLNPLWVRRGGRSDPATTIRRAPGPTALIGASWRPGDLVIWDNRCCTGAGLMGRHGDRCGGSDGGSAVG